MHYSKDWLCLQAQYKKINVFIVIKIIRLICLYNTDITTCTQHKTSYWFKFAGAGNLIDHLQHMINKKFPRTLVWILLILWKLVAPIIILVSIRIRHWIKFDPFCLYWSCSPVTGHKSNFNAGKMDQT